jgi:RNA polymerase sigma-70 factor (ECF subfamily)
MTERSATRTTAGAAIRPFEQAGLDEAAFEALYREQWSAVLNYVRYRLAGDEAADVAAELFTRAWSRRAQFDAARGTPTAWLWALVRNGVTDLQRARRPTPGELRADLAGPLDVQRDVLRRQEADRAVAALAFLSERDREIVALRFGAGLGNRDIASMMEMTEGNVAVRLHRALHRLRSVLREGDEP